MPDFLEPISDSQPCGEYLRYDPVYDQIKEARRSDEADPGSMGIWQPVNPKGTDWSTVRKLCEQVLSQRSKDLQIAYWLIEVKGHEDHFPGIADGLEIFYHLMDTFWETIHPQIEEDDYDFRLVPIRNIANDLTPILYTLPITDPSSEQLPTLNYFDFTNIKRGESDYTLEQGQRSIQETDKHWLKETVINGVKKTVVLLKRIEDFAVERCGQSVPSFSAGRQCLSEILDTMKTYVPDLMIEETEAEEIIDIEQTEPDGEDKQTAVARPQKVPSSGKSIEIEENRAGAYRLLKEAYKIFEKNDPHSPVKVILQHLIAWDTHGLHQISDILEGSGSSLAVILKTFPPEIEPLP